MSSCKKIVRAAESTHQKIVSAAFSSLPQPLFAKVQLVIRKKIYMRMDKVLQAM